MQNPLKAKFSSFHRWECVYACCFFVLRLPLPLQFCGCVCKEYVDFQYAPVNVILFRLFNKLVKLCTYCKIISKTGATFSINTFVVYANVAHLYGNCVFTNSHKSTLKLCSFWAYNVLFMSIVHSIPIWDIVFVIVSMSREMRWLFLFVPHKHGNFLIIQSRRKNKKNQAQIARNLCIHWNYLLGKRFEGSQTVLSVARLRLCKMHFNCRTTTSYGRTGEQYSWENFSI